MELNKLKIFKYLLLATVFLFNGCQADKVSEPDITTNTAPKAATRLELFKKPDGSFRFPTLYWTTPRGVAEEDWNAVFGGTVIKVETVREKKSDGFPFPRTYVKGALKVEKIFRDLPDSTEITVDSIIESEDFDGLKKGDKVIIFIQEIYEGGFVRIEVDGTNSKLGFKVKDWNEPIVTALEKIAPCYKINIGWVEGHAQNFRAKMYDCYKERNQMILGDPQVTETWKRSDPKGFQYLVDLSEMKEN
jgi:hypothetical protein